MLLVVQWVGGVALVLMIFWQICRRWKRRLSLHSRAVLVVCELRSGHIRKSQPSVQVRATIWKIEGHSHCHRSILMDKTKKLEAFIVYLCETCRSLVEFQHRLMHMQVGHLIIIMTFIIEHNSHHQSAGRGGGRQQKTMHSIMRSMRSPLGPSWTA